MKQLQVYRIHNFYFTHPSDPSRKVYIVTCIPHCFKNLRNNMLDYKLVYKQTDGKEVIVEKNMFERLIHDDSALGDIIFS